MTPKNMIAGLAILLTVVVAGWVWSNADESTELDNITVDNVEDAPRVDAERSSKIPEAQPRKQVTQEEPKEAQIPQVQFESTENLTEENSVLVEVTVENSEAPIQGGIVTVVSFEQIEDQAAAREDIRSDLIAFLSKYGKNYRVPPSGSLRIPTLESKAMIAAYTETNFAYVRGRKDDLGPIKILMQPIFRLQARVKNQKTKEIPGIAVELGRQSPGRRGGPPRNRPILKATTKDDGIATLNVMKAILGEVIKPSKIYVGLEGVFKEKPMVTFDMNALPKDIIEIETGEVASILVHITGPNGKPMNTTCGLSVSISDPPAANSRPGMNSPVYWKTTATGEVTIPLVQCNLNLELGVDSIENSALKPLTKKIVGPTNPGETLEVTLQFADTLPMLSGRLLDPAGKPLVNEKIRTKIVSRSKGSSGGESGRTRTDAKGFFKIPLKTKYNSAADERFITIKLAATKSTRAASAKRSLGTDQGLLPSTDLGDITLEEVPLLVSGTVEDADGNPVAGAFIGIQPMPNRPNGYQGWSIDMGGSVTTNRKGEFVVYGTCSDDEFSLQVVRVPNFLNERIEAHKGQEGIRVLLRKGGTLKAHVVLPGSLTSDDLRINLKANDKDKRYLNLEKDGTLRAERLEPGAYDLEIALKNSRRALLYSKKSIHLAAGATVDLGEIILKTKGNTVTLNLLEPKLRGMSSRRPRAEIYRVEVVARRPGTEEVIARISMWRDAKKTTFLPEVPCDLTVSCSGYRDLLIEDVVGGQVDIRMKKGIPVKIKVTNADILPKHLDLTINLNQLKNGAIHHGAFSQRQKRLDDLILVSSPGTYIVTAMLGRTEKNGSGIYSGLRIKAREIKVFDQDALQTFSVTIEPDSVKSAAGDFDED